MRAFQISLREPVPSVQKLDSIRLLNPSGEDPQGPQSKPGKLLAENHVIAVNPKSYQDFVFPLKVKVLVVPRPGRLVEKSHPSIVRLQSVSGILVVFQSRSFKKFAAVDTSSPSG